MMLDFDRSPTEIDLEIDGRSEGRAPRRKINQNKHPHCRLTHARVQRQQSVHQRYTRRSWRYEYALCVCVCVCVCVCRKRAVLVSAVMWRRDVVSSTVSPLRHGLERVVSRVADCHFDGRYVLNINT